MATVLEAVKGDTVGEVELYDLYMAHSAGRRLLVTDKNISLGKEDFAYPIRGRLGTSRYDDVVGVTLSSTQLKRACTMGQCTIHFASGSILRLLNVSGLGRPDAAHSEHFRRFVRDFHARLIASGAASRIVFRSGMSESRANFANAVIVVAALMFVVLPVILLFITHQPKGLFVCLAGASLVWPLYKSVRRNRPAVYQPTTPPDIISPG